jgi:hypothetical protein
VFQNFSKQNKRFKKVKKKHSLKDYDSRSFNESSKFVITIKYEITHAIGEEKGCEGNRQNRKHKLNRRAALAKTSRLPPTQSHLGATPQQP